MEQLYYRRMMLNTIYLIGASLISNLVLFLSNILIARSFEPSIYGNITLVISVSSFFTLTAEMGIPMAAAKFIAEYNVKKQNVIPAIIASALKLTGVFSIIGMLFLFFSATWLSNKIFHNKDISSLLKISSAWIVCTLLFRVFSGIFNGFQQMGFSLISSFLFYGLRFLALITIVCLGMGINEVIVGWTFAHLIGLFFLVLIFYAFLQKKQITISYNSSGCENQIIRYGIYFALPFLGIYLIPYVLNMIVGSLSNIENVAFLSISISLASLSFVILTPISNILMPVTAEAFADNEWEKILSIGRLFFKYVWTIGFIALSILSLFGYNLITFFYGTKYASANDALLIIAFAVFIESAKIVTDPLLNGTKYANMVARIEILKFALIICLGSGLIYWIDITGAALSILISYSISTILKIYQVQNRLKLYLIDIVINFILLIIILLLFIYFDFSIWLFILAVTVVVLYQKMLTIHEVKMFFSLLMNNPNSMSYIMIIGACISAPLISGLVG